MNLHREQYFRALTELSSDVVTVVSEEGVFRYVSPSVTRVLGYAPEALLRRSAFEIVAPEDELLARDVLQRLRSTDEVLPELEVRVRDVSGAFRVVEIVGRNLLNDPSVAGLILNVRDVTDRKRAESRIREQAALLDKAQDAILVCNLDSVIQYWNQRAERIYGWSAAEALGRKADELLYRNEAARPIAAFKGLISRGEWQGELLHVNRQGHEIIMESRWSLVQDRDGEPESILIIGTDVTETRKLQAKFLRAQRMESIGALAGGIAHDLNNVLAPVLMAAELLRTKVTDRECQEWLDTLSESARRGADLIRQILSFARGTGEQVIDIQLRHLIREHERILRETLPRSITISASVPQDLWLVKGNPTQLSQVLMNLSVNARDAMPNGGQIMIRARNLALDELAAKSRPELASGPYVVVSVSDTGTGIPASIITRIFEPFFTTKDVTKGTGLGLATAQGIAKSHSGVLTVSSEVGKGTQFDLYLPAVLTEAIVQVDLEKPPLPHGKGQCILIVDDEASSRALLSATLKAYGYQVLVASNGAEGLKLFTTHQEQVALVLTDVAMPEMDGMTFIRALRAIQPQLRILALSGLVEHAAHAIASLRDVQLLAKPCSAEELLPSVHRLLETAR